MLEGISTTKTAKEIKASIRELRREMKANGIKATSCMNGGIDRVTWRYNARLFELKTFLGDALKAEARNA